MMSLFRDGVKYVLGGFVSVGADESLTVLRALQERRLAVDNLRVRHLSVLYVIASILALVVVLLYYALSPAVHLK